MEFKFAGAAGRCGTVLGKLRKNKMLVICLLAGCLLLIISTGGSGVKNTSAASGFTVPEISVEEQEKRFSAALSRMDGAGKVAVLLTVDCSTEREIIQDGDNAYREEGETIEEKSSYSAVKINGGDNAVTAKYIYPEYRGALVISQGAGSPSVRLALTEAISALTGLKSDKITVIKMED